MPNPMRIEICCDPLCPNVGIQQEIELTDEEVAEMQAMAAQAEAERQAAEAEKERIEALKISARTKLVSGQPLTEEEASLLVI